MTTCKLVYLDIDGNRSDVYYDTLKTKGAVEAEKAYIEDIMSLDPKFSRTTNKIADIQSLKDHSKSLTITPDGKRYTDGYDFYSRITQSVDSYKEDPDSDFGGFTPKAGFDAEAVSMDLARKDMLVAAVGGNAQDVPQSKTARIKLEKEYEKAHPDFLKDKAASYRMSWDGSRDWGDHIHLVFQRVLEKRTALLAKDPEANMDSIIYTVKAEMEKKGEWKKGVARTANYASIVRGVLQEIQDIETEIGSKVTVLPELKLSSSTLKIAGTADIVLISEEGEAFILDFKSKTNNSLRSFDTASKSRFGGPFVDDDLSANAENSARVQMSHYAAILHEMGFKISSRDPLRTVVITGTFKAVEGRESTEPWGFTSLGFGFHPGSSKKKTYKEAIIRSQSLHERLINDTKEAKDKLEEERSTGLHGFMDEVSTPEIKSDLSGIEPSSNLNYVKSKEDVAVRHQLLNEFVEGDTKRKYINRKNPLIPRDEIRIYLDSNTVSEVEEILRNDFKISRDDQLSLPNKIISYFEHGGADSGPNTHNLQGRTGIVNKMLHGITRETHRLTRADRFHPSLREVGNDVLVAENKLTGAVSFFSVVGAANTSIVFEVDGSKSERTTVFGKYATDVAVRSKIISSDITNKAKMHELLSMKLGYAAMALKNASSKPLVIEHMRVGSIIGGDHGMMTTTFIAKEIIKLNTMVELAPREVVPDHIREIVTKPSNKKDSSYGFSYVEELSRRLATTKHMLSDYNSGSMLEQALEEKIRQWKQGEIVPYALIQDLTKFKREVYESKKTRGQNVESDRDLDLINSAIAQLQEMNINSIQIMGSKFDKTTLRSATNSGDIHHERAQVLYDSAAANIRSDFAKFNRANKRLVRAFFKEAREAGVTDHIEAYKTIFVDPEFENGDSPEGFMMLKSEEDLAGRPAAQAYAKFVLDTIDAKYKEMLTEKEYKNYKNGSTWTRGHIPILKSTKSFMDKKTYKSIGNVKDAVGTNLRGMKKKHYDANMSFGFGYEHTEAYTKQVGTEGGSQHTSFRTDILGIHGNNSEANPRRDIEMDLTVVMNNMVTTASEQAHMSVVTETIEATVAALKKHGSNQDNLSIKNTIDTLEKWAKIVIQNDYGDGTGGVVTTLDVLGRVISLGYFSGSLRQAFTESFTGIVQGSSSLISNSLQRMIDKNSGRFGVKDFAWGLQAVKGTYGADLETLAYQLLWDNGMVYADPAQLKQKEFASTSKSGLMRSRPMQYLNQLFFNSSIGTTFLAEIHSKGIHKAYTKEEVDGRVIYSYNETLDPRFYVYDASKPGFGESNPPTTPDEKKKYSLWKAVRAKMTTEGSIEEGLMTIPLTAQERTSIKFYATKLYGSFNKDKEVVESTHVLVRSMLKYKSWFLQKIANYHTASDESKARGEFVYYEDATHEDGGYTQFEGLPVEGIIQSGVALYKNLVEYKSMGKSLKNLHPVQKENLGKLLADLILVGIILTLFSQFLKDKNSEFAKSGFGGSLQKGLTNATSDLNVAATMLAMNDTSMAAVSMALNAVGNLKDVAVYSAMFDGAKAGQSFDKFSNIIGAKTTGRALLELGSKITG